MTQQKMIINRSQYCDWRFNGGSDDWENFQESYGYSPQFVIDGVKTIEVVSLDEIFSDCGYENSKKIGQSKSIDIVE